MQPRFDYYQATVRGTPHQNIVDALMAKADGMPKVEVAATKLQGYGFQAQLDDMDGLFARVYWGGSQPDPHVISSGIAAKSVAECLRSEFPHSHFVSRADSCVDYSDPGAYDFLQDAALAVAVEKGIKVDTAGDHLVTKQGRTLYLGGNQSVTKLRIYDKAAELRSKLKGAMLLEVPEHLTRFEIQVRPHGKQAKAKAASASPLEFMASAAWSRELIKRIEGVDLQPVSMRVDWRQPDIERSYAAMISQYGAILRAMKADLGSWECLGMQLGHDIDAAEKRR